MSTEQHIRPVLWVASSKKDIDLIKSRLNIAKELYQEWKKKQKK